MSRASDYAGPLLGVRDLTASIASSKALVLDRISFDLEEGEAVGVLGESGAGKTTLARSLNRLLPSGWRLSGSVRFQGTEMLKATERQLLKLRGAGISQIFQEPELALSPVMTAGKQVDEVLRAHCNLSQEGRREQVDSLLATVGLSGSRIYSAYPHQLSGGQRQRIVIAQALISKPRLLIADEPTSSLDNVLQAEILGVLKCLRKKLGLALIFITHNPALLSGLADRVFVMSAGRVIETGSLEQICWAPAHPETESLLKAVRACPV